jgi:hypothetical protein
LRPWICASLLFKLHNSLNAEKEPHIPLSSRNACAVIFLLIALDQSVERQIELFHIVFLVVIGQGNTVEPDLVCGDQSLGNRCLAAAACARGVRMKINEHGGLTFCADF